ncbi:mycothione reductase [Auraticoccus monumenti]|uniref:Mycothione reductase n=1 Tax=Auraticoccus monumenti TaxID=675864 RepID=A0A1G6RIJ7_9ACTN|nr:mycothione reductase [Auraticoccus monumenti]SDD04223.1 mycothione reductase [Auraticoccus monumenti]
MRHFDLVIIGSGSGNSLIDESLDGQRVALVDKGIFGGTCLNVGCIPTKMYVHPANLASTPERAARLGVGLRRESVDWVGIRDRIFTRIDAISSGGEDWRRRADNVTLYRERGRFTGERTFVVGDEEITADRFVVAAGSRPVVPDVPGVEQEWFEHGATTRPAWAHTSDTVMRIDALPASMVIVGGGFVAAEFAHVFASFGVDVTIVLRSDRMLREEDADVSARFTDLMARRVRLVRGTTVAEVRAEADGSGATVVGEDGSTHHGDLVLFATGRVPNGDTLDLPKAGIGVDDAGRVVVDAYQRTTAEGVFALGDVSNRWQLKHVANAEMRVVKHNLAHPDAMIRSDHRFVPHAVFSEPQVASVGLTEQEARDAGLDVVTAHQDYGSIAYGWAMEDDTHFAKLVAERGTGRLLGAHIIGPEASVLIQPLIQAMSFGLGAREMATGQYWIHPAMTELVENALLALDL